MQPQFLPEECREEMSEHRSQGKFFMRDALPRGGEMSGGSRELCKRHLISRDPTESFRFGICGIDDVAVIIIIVLVVVTILVLL